KMRGRLHRAQHDFRHLHSNQKESGLALLMVMLLLFVMIILVTQLLSTTQIQSMISENLSDEHMSFYFEETALLKVEEVLFQDIEPPPMKSPDELGLSSEEMLVQNRMKSSDSYHDHWAKEQDVEQNGESWIRTTIVDEERKFNINTLIHPTTGKLVPKRKAFFVELLKVLGVKDVDTKDIIDNFVDFLDKDENGKFDDETSKNAFMTQLKECLVMEEVDDELYYGIDYPVGELWTEADVEKAEEEAFDNNFFDYQDELGQEEEKKDVNPFEQEIKERKVYEDWEEDEFIPGFKDVLTVYGDGKININTAPLPVLEAIFEEETIALAVIEARKEAPFDGFDSLKQVTGASSAATKYVDMLSFQSRYFKVIMEIRHRRVTKKRQAMMMREGSQATTLYRGAQL
ncbi:MAG: general secretion pathway protein GspK, partial [Planctomycetes bacterium]|nr:general secretion pathway protein GspK [Planctomycetota bacterium]